MIMCMTNIELISISFLYKCSFYYCQLILCCFCYQLSKIDNSLTFQVSCDLDHQKSENCLITKIVYNVWNKMKTTRYHTVGTFAKSNRKIVENGNIDPPNTQKHKRSPFWLGKGTAIKAGGAKLVLWTQTNKYKVKIRINK